MMCEIERTLKIHVESLHVENTLKTTDNIAFVKYDFLPGILRKKIIHHDVPKSEISVSADICAIKGNHRYCIVTALRSFIHAYHTNQIISILECAVHLPGKK